MLLIIKIVHIFGFLKKRNKEIYSPVTIKGFNRIYNRLDVLEI